MAATFYPTQGFPTASSMGFTNALTVLGRLGMPLMAGSLAFWAGTNIYQTLKIKEEGDLDRELRNLQLDLDYGALEK